MFRLGLGLLLVGCQATFYSESTQSISSSLDPREYCVTVQRIIDGDTLDLRVEVWPTVFVEDRFRLLGIDAPEITGIEKTQGLRSKAWLQEQLDLATSIIVQIRSQSQSQPQREKYGRWLCILWIVKSDHSRININAQMLIEKLARAY